MQSSNASRFGIGAAILAAALIGGCGQKLSPEEHLTRAESALARGEFREAVIEYKNVLLAQPDNLDARIGLGRSLVELGNPVAGEQDLERALQLGADASRVQPWLAESWLGQGKYDRVNALTVPSDLTGEQQAALLAVQAEARLAQGQVAEAEAAATAALQAQPESTPATLIMARVKARESSFDEARRLVEQVLKRESSNAVAENLLGEIERAAGRLSEAEAAFTRAMTDARQAAESQLNRAYVRIQANQLDEAEKDIKALQARIKGNVLIDYAEALLLYTRQDYAKAIERLDTVLGTSPDYIPAVRLAGATRLALEEPARARVHLQRAASALPEDIETQRMLIMALLQLGEASEAERLARNLVEQAPQDTGAMDLLASALMMQGKRAESVSYLQRVSLVLPDSAAASARLGSALLGQGDAEEGLKALREALERDPTLQGAAEQLVLGYVASGDLDQALSAATEYRDRDPSSARAQALLGAVYLQRKQIPEAKQAFRQALELEPGHLAAATGLATLALQEDDITTARAQFADSLKYHPEDDRLRLLLARLAMAQNDTDAAKAYLDEAVERNPTALLPKLYLAAYYQRIGDPGQSLELLAALRRDFPDNAMVLGLMADANLSLREFAAARTVLEELVTQAPDNAQVRVALANALANLGEVALAQTQLDKALELEPDSVPAANLLARLALANKDTAGAERGLRNLKRLLGDTHPDVLLIEGQLAQLQGNPSAANEVFQQLLTAGDGAVDFDADPNLRGAAEQMILGYVRNGDPDGALKAALELRERQPDSVRANLLLATLYLRGQQPEQAAQSFQRALELEPGNISATTGLASIAIQNKDFAQARTLYEASLAQHPSAIALLVGLARLELLDKDPKAAERHLTLAVSANPLAIQPKLLLAAFQLRQGYPENALETLRETSTLAPENLNLLGLKAEAELALKRYEAALDTLNTLNRLKPDQPRVLLALASAEAGLGHLDAAERLLQRVLTVDAQSVAALNALARLAIARKTFSEAAERIAALEAVMGADNASVLLLQGNLAEARGDLPAALNHYQRFFDQAPSVQSAVLLARARIKSDDPEGARTLLADWLGLHPEDVAVRFELAQFYLNTGRNDEAIQSYEMVLEKSPGNPVVLNNLAWLLQERDLKRALEYARQAHATAPKSADIADTLAVILARLGETLEARRMIDLALDLNADNASLLFHKAQILKQAGERVQAEQTLEAVLKSGRTFPERAEAETLLRELKGG
ncbi:XrtA/PEP-CTERM system TPR-repeat protein PrsT [Allochromatium palmeri]|uniref:PEP-CTERM system TPR-repeat protein PrsT n=1 Tax=Allochromatium palmeri TaxID=231048 RepID=A0A6N8EGE7_9GAMM|nr:XrtA/PEP-CTERM system TPR-repeat protein PrsT [Allochromatium palmeri]MTW21746.1 PEP-CTERM system TPR-repeat protein PrsT [Allochromatium palmeri]